MDMTGRSVRISFVLTENVKVAGSKIGKRTGDEAFKFVSQGGILV